MAIDLSRFLDHDEVTLSFEDDGSCQTIIDNTANYAGWNLTEERSKYSIQPDKSMNAILIQQVAGIIMDANRFAGDRVVVEGGSAACVGLEWRNLPPSANRTRRDDPPVRYEIERGIGVMITLPAWLFEKKRAATKRKAALA